ncbi:MAG TPA: hypothetical protein VGH27_15080 [Streptosporangiaceae bacterium]
MERPRTSSRRWRLAGISAALALAALWGAGPAMAASPAATTWSRGQLPLPGGSEGGLAYGVSCPTATFCMAVQQESTDMWNGTSWTAQTIPTGHILFGVSCTSATWCVAIGVNDIGTETPAAFRWNGTRWLAMTVALPAGISQGSLGGVSCVSRTSCMATGGPAPGDGTQGFVESWNGSTWTASTVPNTGDLEGVDCLSSTSCFAVGDEVADYWNGSTWTDYTISTTYRSLVLESVSCSSATSCMAVGTGNNTYPRGVIFQWNGTSWTSLADGLGAGSDNFTGVSCSATACTASGQKVINDENQLMVDHWNGVKWHPVAAVDTPAQDGYLNGISCHTQTSCVAVGSSGVVEQES